MSSTTPQEQLTASTVIERIESGAYGRDVITNLARGFLPLPQEDLIAVLAFLIGSGDAEFAALARTSLKEIPIRSVVAFASSDASIPEHLTLLARATEDPAIIEPLIRNRALPDEAVVELAGHGDPVVQEIIVINQARILRAPQILDALLANPKLSPDARRRALETREEFFDKKARLERLAEDEVADFLDDEPIADLLAKAAQDDAAGVPAPVPELSEPERKDPAKLSLFQRILAMTVGEKVQLGFKGGKTERSILIRDRNRLICSAVMRNPRMSESEAENIAGMRNVDDEALRLISTRREWMSKYNIAIALARNPKCPIGVVVPLINRLTLRDLKSLKDDKGVSEVVRSMSRKLYQQRSKKS